MPCARTSQVVSTCNAITAPHVPTRRCVLCQVAPPEIFSFMSAGALSSTAQFMGKANTAARSLGISASSCFFSTAGSTGGGVAAAAGWLAAAVGAGPAAPSCSCGGCCSTRNSSSEYLQKRGKCKGQGGWHGQAGVGILAIEAASQWGRREPKRVAAAAAEQVSAAIAATTA